MLKFLRNTALYLLAVPVLSIVLGRGLNQLVLNANGDTFPVHISQAKLEVYEHGDTTVLKDGTKLVGDVMVLSDGKIMLDSVHCVMTDKTHLNFLADIIDVGSIKSFGDLLLDFGDWTWTFMPYVWGFTVVVKLKDKEL